MVELNECSDKKTFLAKVTQSQITSIALTLKIKCILSIYYQNIGEQKCQEIPKKSKLELELK